MTLAVWGFYYYYYLLGRYLKIWIELEFLIQVKFRSKNVYLRSKEKGNDQELIQSDPTSHPQNQKGKKHT